jgi:hypothetical protein
MECRLRRCCAPLFVLAAVAACSSDRGTLLQLDVIMPAHPVAWLEVRVGESERREAHPATFPAQGQTLGVDLLLPPELAGTQNVGLVAHDARGCHVAVAGLAIEIVAGQKIHPDTAIKLEDLTAPVCDANIGAPPGASDDGGDYPPPPDDLPPQSLDAPVVDPGDAGAPLADVAIPPPSIDGGEPPPQDASEPPTADASQPVMDMRPPGPVDAGPPAPPPCDGAGNCPAGRNCVAGNVCLPANSCAAIKSQKPGAPDGVYWLGGQQAYCDMRIGAVLCGQTAAEHQGRTRVGPEIPFKLSSELHLADGTCRIWAVRHASDGYPLDRIRNTPSACAAMGFKSGDEGLLLGASRNRSCPYGSNPAPYSDCGFGGPDHRFGGRGFYKWGNTCTGCSPPITAAGYFKQGPVFASDIYWDMTGRVSNFCKVR